MKTAVSLPDELFEAADRLARRRGLTRSALYAEAIERVLDDERRGAERITAQLDEVYADAGVPIDIDVTAAQAQAVREQW